MPENRKVNVKSLPGLAKFMNSARLPQITDIAQIGWGNPGFDAFDCDVAASENGFVACDADVVASDVDLILILLLLMPILKLMMPILLLRILMFMLLC